MLMQNFLAVIKKILMNLNIIKNINISIEGNTIAALVGHSGAGKSTIINLLPRLSEVIKSKKKYSVHDENNKYKNGDKVSIIESRSYSKTKKFEVLGDTK